MAILSVNQNYNKKYSFKSRNCKKNFSPSLFYSNLINKDNAIYSGRDKFVNYEKKVSFGNAPVSSKAILEVSTNVARGIVELFNPEMRVEKLLGDEIFNIETFKKLSKASKRFLRSKTPKSDMNAVKDSIGFAIPLKNFLEKKYGKDNFMVVSIGRSPVMIARAMENMGVETKYLPISHFYSIDIDEFATFTNPKQYLKYIKSLGITPDKLNYGNKKAVFYDFTATGRTLYNMQDFFSYYVGLPKHFMEFRSLNVDLKCLGPKYDEKLEKFLEKYMFLSKAEKYSHIPKLNYWDVQNIGDIISEYKPSKQCQLFNFNLIDKLERMKLLKQSK